MHGLSPCSPVLGVNERGTLNMANTSDNCNSHTKMVTASNNLPCQSILVDTNKHCAVLGCVKTSRGMLEPWWPV